MQARAARPDAPVCTDEELDAKLERVRKLVLSWADQHGGSITLRSWEEQNAAYGTENTAPVLFVGVGFGRLFEDLAGYWGAEGLERWDRLLELLWTENCWYEPNTDTEVHFLTSDENLAAQFRSLFSRRKPPLDDADADPELERVLALCRAPEQGSLVGRVLHKSGGYNMITNDFVLVVRETAKSVWVVRLDARAVTGSYRSMCGTEEPMVDEASVRKAMAFASGRGRRASRLDADEYFQRGKSFYRIWDGQPKKFDHAD